MADIAFVRRHALPIEKAKALVQKVTDSLVEEHGLKSEWHGNTLHFERSGVNGKIHVTDASVHLEVSLGFLLKPFKGRLASEIESSLDKYLPEPKTHAPAKKTAHKAAHKASH